MPRGGARVIRRPFALRDRDHRQCDGRDRLSHLTAHRHLRECQTSGRDPGARDPRRGRAVMAWAMCRCCRMTCGRAPTIMSACGNPVKRPAANAPSAVITPFLWSMSAFDPSRLLGLRTGNGRSCPSGVVSRPSVLMRRWLRTPKCWTFRPRRGLTCAESRPSYRAGTLAVPARRRGPNKEVNANYGKPQST